MKRVLIVGTVPYNSKSTSRAFDAYFYNWERKNIAQIFSNTKRPIKGHCGTLFQITDQRLLKRRFNKNLETGIIYNYNELDETWTDDSLEVNSSFFDRLYKWGSRKRPLTYLLRKIVWKKSYWCTEKLNSWLDSFKPECVFLSFSDDYFIPQIALYVAEKYSVPVISSIGDDYYFNTKFSISPFYYLYKYPYRKLIRRVFRHPGSAIYIGDKIRNKYNNHFGLCGETVYVTSSITRKDFKEINRDQPRITYCGNIRLGRNTSLNTIGQALGKINQSYMLDIYSNETDCKYYRLFDGNPNIKYHGSVSYAEVQQIMLESDIVVVVEGFLKKDVDISRYSLSTKVADSLASGANILAYGSPDCGAINYLNEVGCASVCYSFEELLKSIKIILENIELQRANYMRTKEITVAHHSLDVSTRIFESLVSRVVN